jgi:hypothetical protein
MLTPFGTCVSPDAAVLLLLCTGLLTQFQQYLSGAARSLPRHNNAQLFSGSQFKDGIVGLAGVGTFCSGPLSASICMLKRGSQPLNALVCAHEMYENAPNSKRAVALSVLCAHRCVCVRAHGGSCAGATI